MKAVTLGVVLTLAFFCGASANGARRRILPQKSKKSIGLWKVSRRSKRRKPQSKRPVMKNVPRYRKPTTAEKHRLLTKAGLTKFKLDGPFKLWFNHLEKPGIARLSMDSPCIVNLQMGYTPMKTYEGGNPSSATVTLLKYAPAGRYLIVFSVFKPGNLYVSVGGKQQVFFDQEQAAVLVEKPALKKVSIKTWGCGKPYHPLGYWALYPVEVTYLD